jgi:hypothetical protein
MTPATLVWEGMASPFVNLTWQFEAVRFWFAAMLDK